MSDKAAAADQDPDLIVAVKARFADIEEDLLDEALDYKQVKEGPGTSPMRGP